MDQTIHQLPSSLSASCCLLDVLSSNEDFFNIDESQHIESVSSLQTDSVSVSEITDPILQTMLGELGHSLNQASKLENERLLRISFLLKFSKRYKKRQLAEANSNWQASLAYLPDFFFEGESTQLTYSREDSSSPNIDCDGSQECAASQVFKDTPSPPTSSSNRKKSVSFSIGDYYSMSSLMI
jgi:hypothetical protein